jgi:hypothetical protein
MKRTSTCILITFVLATALRGQGTFLYDQQSSTDDTYSGHASPPITENQPFGQSFTPSLSGVDFIRLYLGNGVPFDNGPATLHINLRADSITGTILDSTQPLTLAPGFNGPATFIFSNPVRLTAGTMYYFQPVVDIGGIWGAAGSPNNYNYPGGTIFGLGVPNAAEDLWFREGIIVPEPSSAALILLGTGCWFLSRRRPKI